MYETIKNTADDTKLIMKNRKDVNESTKEIIDFLIISGLSLNTLYYRKTKINYFQCKVLSNTFKDSLYYPASMYSVSDTEK